MATVNYRVRKAFTYNGVQLKPGDPFEPSGGPNDQKIIDQKILVEAVIVKSVKQPAVAVEPSRELAEVEAPHTPKARRPRKIEGAA